MTFRYIGSKSRLVDQIKDFIGPNTGGFFVDAFCGTGVVAEAASELGWPVRINDHLSSAVISAGARLLSVKEVKFKKLGGYEGAIAKLNAAQAIEGFIWRSYSPASYGVCGIERRYFTEKNAGRIDAIRALIHEWSQSGLIGEAEERLLIVDLLGALNRVANIAGTFGCFLSKWTAQANDDLMMRCRKLKSTATLVEESVGDVFDVHTDANDVVYLDPPYTKRQYASYYHILETVALGDAPVIEGVAGLRPWRDRASDFCYKLRAMNTLAKLVDEINAQRILLSYSSEGHISINELSTELSKYGTPTIYPLGSIGRYRPNKAARDGSANVKEYLVVISREMKRTMHHIKPPTLRQS